MWTSGLQLRKRKRPSTEKDSFVSKKRRLLDTTNKIVAFKEAKRKEALRKDAEKVVKVAARTASSQTALVPQEKTTAAPQAVQTTAATVNTAPTPRQTAVATPSAATAQSTALQIVQSSATANATAPTQMQTTAASSSATLAQSAVPQIAQPTTTIAATMPAQTPVTVQHGASSTSATLAQSTVLQMAYPATTVASTTPAQTPVTIQSGATSTSATLVQSPVLQMTQPATTIASTTPAQTLVTIQSDATSTSSTLVQSAVLQMGHATTTVATTMPVQTPVTAQNGVTSTSATLAQPSVQNAVLTQTLAPSTSITSVSVANTATTPATSSNLSNVLSQNVSPVTSSLQSSVSLSTSVSVTTDQPVSSLASSSRTALSSQLPRDEEASSSSLSRESPSSLQTNISSPTPLSSTPSDSLSSTLPSEKPEVQIPSSTASSTAVVAASNSSDPFSSLTQTMSTSSALVSDTINSVSKCLNPPPPSTPINCVSADPAVVASSASPAAISKDPSSLPDSNLDTDIENNDQLLGDDNKPETSTVSDDYTSGQAKHLRSANLVAKTEVSDLLANPSTADSSSDVGNIPVMTSLSCQKQDDQTSTSLPDPCSANVLSSESLDEVCDFPIASQTRSSVEQNCTQSTVIMDSSPCVPLTAGATQISDVSSNCLQKNAVDVDDTFILEQVRSVEDHAPDCMKQNNSLSTLESQSITKESSISSTEDFDAFSAKNLHELSDQGPIQDKSSSSENQPVTTTEAIELVNLADAPMANHDQEYIDVTRDNEIESTITYNDVNGLENLEAEEDPSLKSKECFNPEDEKMEETKEKIQLLENNSVVDNQDKTVERSNLSGNEGLPDCQKGDSASTEVSELIEGRIEDNEKEFLSVEKTAVVCSSNGEAISDRELSVVSQTRNALVNELVADESDAKEVKEEYGLSVVSVDSNKKVNEDVSIVVNDDLLVNEVGGNSKTESSGLQHLDSLVSDIICNHDEVSLLDDMTNNVSSTKEEVTENTAKTSCSETTQAIELTSSPPRTDDASSKDEQSSGEIIACEENTSEPNVDENTKGEIIACEENTSETKVDENTKCDDHAVNAVNESSDGDDANVTSSHVSSDPEGSQSLGNVDVSHSSKCEATETSRIPAEEPMDVDATNASSTQSSVETSLPLSSIHNTEEEPMEVDVTTVSSSQNPTAVTTRLTGAALSNTDSCSPCSSSTEGAATSGASTNEVAPIQGEVRAKTSIASLPDTEKTDMCSKTIPPSVSTSLSSVLVTTDTADAQLTDNRAQVNSALPSTTATAVSTAFPSQSTSQQSQALRSAPVTAVTTVSQSLSSTASTASAVKLAATVTVTTTASLSTLPVASAVPSPAVFASPRVVAAGSQGVAIGGSPIVPLAQPVPVKAGSGSPTVLTTAVTRGIAPQKTTIAVGSQGQTSQYVPLGLKPILPSPRPPGLTTGIQGPNVVRVNTQPAASGQQTNLAPVNSIAALVASIPTSGATIGPTQLIKFVTPDGKTITLQGSQLAAIAQQAASPMGLAVPKTIRVQVSTTAVQQNPPTTVQKTVGVKTPGATITVQRPPPQVALAKPQVGIKPKVPPKPLKEEKFPSLEALIKDPRALLNRRLAKWPLRHSVKSVFALQKHELRKLGRKAGMKEVNGFSYTSRGVGKHWPAGIPRPSFKVAWRFRTQSLKTLAGAGLQLKILQSCLKWEEMNIRPPRGNSNTVYTSSGECYC